MDMDDTAKLIQSDNPDINVNTDGPLIQKSDSFQSLTHKNELNSETTANYIPNGHYKRAALPLGLTAHSPGRAVLLEPIPPKLRRGRRLSSDATLQSIQAVSKSDSEATTSSDELITKMFSNSCMEALNFLKKAFEEKLVSCEDM